MIKQRQPKASIQRDGAEDVMIPVENMLGHVSNVGDAVGNEKGLNQSTAGGVVGTVGSIGGIGLGAVKMGVKGHELHKVSGELTDVREREEAGEDGLYATIALLERKKSAAQKGVAEGAGTVLGGISGAINSIAGFWSASTAQLVSKIAGPIGAGLAAILGTIAAIRDFMNVHKRRKSKDAISLVIESYAGLATSTEADLQSKRGELNTLLQIDPENRTFKQKVAFLNLGTAIAALEDRFDKMDAMRISLAVSKRKQGAGGKVLSGITNLVGVAGSGALMALGLGALGVAGVGAAAGPIGWALVGAAAVVALSYFIGQKIKQAIRTSNVTRMNEEIALVDEFLTSGTVSGTPVVLENGTDATTVTPVERRATTWKRSMFPTVEKKGWFNKLISKSKSGKMTVRERREELAAYLAKYDKEAASNTVWEGFKRALVSDEGNLMVENPAYDSKKPQPGVPEKITLRQQIENLITFYFGQGKVAEFVKSIQAGGDKEKQARSLLMQKMKLEDK